MSKIFVFLTLVVACSNALSEGPDFNVHKQEVIGNLEKRISALTEAKSCISAAADKESMKKCRADLKEEREELREAMKDRKKERMENRMKKMEEKKKNLENSAPKE